MLRGSRRQTGKTDHIAGGENMGHGGAVRRSMVRRPRSSAFRPAAGRFRGAVAPCCSARTVPISRPIAYPIPGTLRRAGAVLRKFSAVPVGGGPDFVPILPRPLNHDGRSFPASFSTTVRSVPLEARLRSGAEGARRADPVTPVLGVQKPVEDLERAQGRKALEVDM